MCDYKEGLLSGWRGLISVPVAFPFGHGLSYSEFHYSWLSLPQYHVHNRSVHLSARVTNGGDLPGADVAQLYVSFPAHAHEPPLVLRDFSKSRVLGPGEAMSVAFNLGVEQHLSIWGTTPAGDEGWQPVSGLFEISIGSSSRDLRLKHKVQVDA